MSWGIWFVTVENTPGFEGVADLLPMKRLRGFVAFEQLDDFCSLAPSPMAMYFDDQRQTKSKYRTLNAER